MTNNKIIHFWLFLLFFGYSIKAQEITPPLDIPLLLSGNFGEFRQTHFHLGLDIKTQGKEGFPVKSILAGSIRRIRVATTGYGKVLYISHLNGTTSVYAHLQKFSDKIEKIVKGYQYEEQRFLIQKHFKVGEISIDKGEVIGYSGNTGGSFGPHLHFEIRNTSTQTPLNPLRLDLDIQDTRPPSIQSLYGYDINPLTKIKKKEILLIKKNDSVYTTPILNWSGEKGIGVRVFDRQDSSYNKNGVYHASIKLNGKEVISYTFDQVKFRDGNFINTLIDYETYELEGFRIQKLFKDLPFEFSFLSKESPNGIMNFEAGKSYQIEIILEDFHGNRTYVESYVNGIEAVDSTKRSSEEISFLSPKDEHHFKFDNREVYLPKDTFFEPAELSVTATPDSLSIVSMGYTLRNPFHIKFEAPPPPTDSIQPYPWSIARVNKNEELEYVSTEYKDDVLITKDGTPGTYLLVKDSLAPKITPLNFEQKQWLSNYSYLKIKVEDDFSGIKEYKGTINNQWILLEHEPKDNMLFYSFNDINFDKFQLDFKLEVEDMQGNSSVFEATIFRKPKSTQKQ